MKSLIGRPFKSIKKFTLIEKNKETDYFKIWFSDKSTAVYNANNVVVMKSRIIRRKNAKNNN